MKIELKKKDFAKFFVFDKIYGMHLVVSTIGGRCKFYGYYTNDKNDFIHLAFDYGPYEGDEETIYVRDFLDNLEDGLYTITPDSYSVGVKSFINIQYLVDDDVKKIVEWNEDFKAKNELMITNELLSVLGTIKKMASVGNSADAVLINRDRILFSDTASVLDYKFETDVKEDGFTLPFELLPLVETGITLLSNSESIFYFEVGNFKVEIKKSWMLEYPTPEDIVSVCPLPDRQAVVEIETSDFISTIKKFDDFPTEVFRWGQIHFTFLKNRPEALLLDYKSSSMEINDAVLCELKSDLEPELMTEFNLPTLYFKKISPLMDETFTMAFNAIGPRTPNGQAVIIESGNLRLVLCKLIMATK